ncbi:BQ5605_C001g00240 [Microbotryum silenes-dioicae]|uniref:BQ5605_C001g00240 protein n=1 Tax=Microbotryum silenes-dioicae TaxID=796604 RepID=A0A2X0M2U5_9BASI|nr:BQ5605_C001g00240 [Microbotryum silenes-dioicae]
MAEAAGDKQWKESISLEETNKIRVSLGLKPISDAPSKAATADKLAADNFASAQSALAQQRDAKAQQDRIDKARNTRERAKRLVGIGLGEVEPKIEGESSSSSGGAKDWVKLQKKRAKELAAKREKDLLEEEKRAMEESKRNRYGEEDLKGLKVAHGMDDLEEGDEAVLTLVDRGVLEDDDDELQNVNMAENLKTAEALKLKKKGKQAGQYTGYDDDEFNENAASGPSTKSVLAKYDDEEQEEGFRLGSAPVPRAAKGDGMEGASGFGAGDADGRERVKLSMEYTKSFNSDYLQEGEVGFKVKKKKKRPQATRTTGALLGAEETATNGDATSMDVDQPSIQTREVERQNLDSTNLIDDDDLQASLARQRREANKKRIQELKKRAADRALVKEEEREEEMDVKAESGDEGMGGGGGGGGADELVLDDTSTFVRNITLAAAERALSTNGAVKKEPNATSTAPAASPAGPQVKAEPVDEPLSLLDTAPPQAGPSSRRLTAAQMSGWGEAREDGEESDDGEDAQMRDPYDDRDDRGRSISIKPENDVVHDDDDFGTSGEKLYSQGLAGTLAILKKTGAIVPRTPEEIERDRKVKADALWIAKLRQRDAEREAEKLASKAAGSSKTQQQREYENRLRDQREAQETLDRFKEYKPNVKLTYHDEFGRDQTKKEAWKQLSHSFHGKTNGAKNTERRLRKIENERKAAAMAAGDTPTGSASAFAARAERTGSATMILSVGNKGSAPMQEEMLGPNSLTKKRKPTTTNGKAAAAGSSSSTKGARGSTPSGSDAVINDIPMRAIPIGRDESPRPRAGFAPVRGFTTGLNVEGGDGAERFLPIAVKRKAQQDAAGLPNGKSQRTD